MAKRAKMILIDGKALFHRGYHAIPHLTNKDGVPTNAVYGFTMMMLKALGDLKPDYALIAWDKAKTSLTSRLEWYPQYKYKRLKMPDDFYAQIPLIRELADVMAMPLLELDNYEADDIIGTLVRRYPEIDIVIVTNDRDVFQLLDGNVSVYMARKGMSDVEIYNRDKVRERYGIEPQQIIDLKSLEGDASDSIPGVAGVGEKTALALIQQYGSLKNIYEHIDEIPGKLKDRLASDRDMAFLSYKLATIMCDAPVELDLEAARTGQQDKQAAYDLFRRLDFRSLLAKLPPELEMKPNLFDTPTAKTREHIDQSNYHGVQTKVQLDELVQKLQSQKEFAFDVETDALDVMTANLAGLAVSFDEGEAYYIPVGHKAENQESRIKNQELFDSTQDKFENNKHEQGKRTEHQLDLDVVIAALKPILEDPKIAKVGHNLKFDYEVMKRHGVSLSPITFDTMIAAFLINPLGRAQTLADLAYGELGIEMIPIEDLIGAKGKNQSSFDLANIEDAIRYAAEDADVSWRLYQKLKPELAAAGLDTLAAQMEWPLIPVLGEMELAGIKLDKEYLSKFNKVISSRILELENEISVHAGERFNISSPAQLGQILFTKLGISPTGIKRGKTGISTAASELEKMRGLHPIIDLIFEYRELVKLKNTYVDALPELVSPLDGRIHTSFNQTIAQTGRLSSTNPNLQNIPVRTELGRQIRGAFVAPEGRTFISADYSQIELRVAAALAKDQAMIDTFKRGIDLHLQTAAELFSVPLDKVTKVQRYAAKTINFGVLYGMSAHGLSVATKMSREEAVGFIKRYFEVRPALAAYIEETKQFARKNQYVETLFGRRRPCPEINSNNFIISQAAERMAVNVPIQGTAADIYKLAMIALVPKFDSNTKLLLQIHDELIAESDVIEAEKIAKVMKSTMEGVYDLGVPLAVDTVIGNSWGDLK